MLRGMPILLMPQITKAAIGTEDVCCDRLGILRLQAGNLGEALQWFRRSRIASEDAGDVGGAMRADSLIAVAEEVERQKVKESM
jgi:hypothetical protein